MDKKYGEFFVQKNSDLRKNNINLKNSLIFIDESHFGSNKTNVLTKFLEDNGIDWKNKNTLKEEKIYIISISATPFDEVMSDVSDCKTIVELETDKAYVGVSEFLEENCVYGAKRSDFTLNKKTNSYPIIDYIKDSHQNISNNRGVLFIRATSKKSPIIKENNFIQDNFKIVELDSRHGAISYKKVYDDIQAMLDSQIGTETNKPIIFLIKGAYRAGVTINQNHKNYVYMVYDNSSKSDTTAQALLGRMCGYRNDGEEWKKTKIYVNKQHAEDYSEWEADFKNKTNIPSSRVWCWQSNLTDDINPEKLNSKISTKCNGNFIIKLSKEEVNEFKNAGKSSSGVNNKEYAKNKIKLLNSQFNFDFMGEAYISGKECHSDSVIKKWFDNYEETSYCPSYRVDKNFKVDTNRDELTYKDVGKRIIHVVLDDSKDSLIVYNGILEMKYEIKNKENLIKEHKRT